LEFQNIKSHGIYGRNIMGVILEQYRKEVIKEIEASFVFKNISIRHIEKIMKAVNCKMIGGNKWDFLKDTNGATFYKESHHNIYHPVFLWHDWEMQRYKVNESDFESVRDINLELKEMLEDYGMERERVLFLPLWLAAQLSWIIFKR